MLTLSQRSIRSTLFAGCLIILAFCLRLVLIAHNWPQTNSDEGTVGIMALHIAYHREHPLIYYGQTYMGAFQAYMGAFLFHLFAPSLFSLRLGLVLLFIPYLIVMYQLTCLLYSRGLALVSLFVLGFAPRDLLYHQVLAIGGHAELPLFASLLLLLSCWLALTYRRSGSSSPPWRWLAYPLWGALAGFAIWDDFLILPFVVMSALLLIIVCYREIRLPLILCTLLALLVGVSPLLVFTFAHPATNDPTHILDVTMTWKGQTNTFWNSVTGTVMVALPIVTGGYSLCPVQPTNAKPLLGLTTPPAIGCAAAHTAVGLGFLLLLALAIVQAARAFWQLRRSSSALMEEKQSSSTIYLARLVVLGTAVLTLLEYVVTPQPAMSPWSTSRYLVALPVAFPAVLWPLWSGIDMTRWQTAPLRRVLLMGQYACLALVLLMSLLGALEVWQALPQAESAMQQQYAMIHDLERLGVKHFYTEYWTCDRVAFESREQLTCSVLNDQLQPGMDRYLPYRALVRADPRAAYAFPLSDSAAVAAVIRKANQAGRHGRLLTMDGYEVYLPPGR